MKKPIALLDGDILAYRAAAAMEKTVDWGDGEAHRLSDPEEAASIALATADAWTALAGAGKTIVAFTGDSARNFRKVVMPTYKANRKAAKPLALMHAMQAVMARHPSHMIDGLEADDLLGILATTLPKYTGAVVVSIDKDLRTVPGLHLDPLKEKRPVLITPAEADHRWMMQTLTGDSVDGFTGIPKVGPKTAEKILGKPGSDLRALWEKVRHAYLKAGLTEADAIATARVARILRREDYDKDRKEIRLWHPEKPETFKLGMS